MHDRGRQEQVPLHPGDVQGQDPQRRPVAPGQGDNSGDKDTSYILTNNKCVQAENLEGSFKYNIDQRNC